MRWLLGVIAYDPDRSLDAAPLSADARQDLATCVASDPTRNPGQEARDVPTGGAAEPLRGLPPGEFRFVPYDANRLRTVLTNLLTGLNVTAMEVGYTVFRRAVLRQLTQIANGSLDAIREAPGERGRRHHTGRQDLGLSVPRLP